MMKNILMFVLLSSSISAFGQTADESIYGFREIINLENSSQEKIHNIITEWIGKNFSSNEDAIQFSNKEKIVVKYQFDLNPRIMRTFQNTTTKYIADGLLTFIIREDKFRMDLEVEDKYSFDGKKSNPKSTFEILSGNVNDDFMKTLVIKGFMDVKQYGGFLSSLKTGDKKAKKAQKYVDKELKKGVYTDRLASLSNDLISEVDKLYSSLKKFVKNYDEDDF
ncbi:hypothetical protein N9483_07140 [Flavobacteriaceae bacterium]|nr:hypothetical protein [Flavobacteriaceae bacterium]